MPFKHRRDKNNYMKKYNKKTVGKRVRRNAVRTRLEKEGRVHKGDGNEVDHKTPLSSGGSDGDGNIRVLTRKANREKYNK